MKWTVCFWRSRAAPAEGGPMCPASPTGRARGLTWRLCRAGVQPPGPGSCPPHRRRRPAGPALWHRSEAAGEWPGPRPRTPQALALPVSAELGRARGTPPAGAAHTPTRQEGLQLTGEGHPPGGPCPIRPRSPSFLSSGPLTDALQLLLGAGLQNQQPQLLGCGPVGVGARSHGLRVPREELGGDTDGCRRCVPVQLHAPAQGSLPEAVGTPAADRGQAQRLGDPAWEGTEAGLGKAGRPCTLSSSGKHGRTSGWDAGWLWALARCRTCRRPAAGATGARRRTPQCRPGSGPWRQLCSGLRKPGVSARAACLPRRAGTAALWGRLAATRGHPPPPAWEAQAGPSPNLPLPPHPSQSLGSHSLAVPPLPFKP